MPPQKNTRTSAPDEDEWVAADAAADAAESTPEPGPDVIDGPFGTTVASTDQRLGTLRVEIKSNVTLGNQLFTVGQKVNVVDDGETRGAIAVGHARLLEDDEKLDSEA